MAGHPTRSIDPPFEQLVNDVPEALPPDYPVDLIAPGKAAIPAGNSMPRPLCHRIIERLEDNMPRGPIKRTIPYSAPRRLPNRQENYRIAWNAFLERGIVPQELQ